MRRLSVGAGWTAGAGPSAAASEPGGEGGERQSPARPTWPSSRAPRTCPAHADTVVKPPSTPGPRAARPGRAAYDGERGQHPSTNAPTTLIASVGQGKTRRAPRCRRRGGAPRRRHRRAATTRRSVARRGARVTRPGWWRRARVGAAASTTGARVAPPSWWTSSARNQFCRARCAGVRASDSRRSARQNASATSNISVIVTKMGPASGTIGKARSTRGSRRLRPRGPGR